MRGSGVDDLVGGVADGGEGGLDIRRRDLQFDQ
jgi:hypothetical protein